MLEDVGQRMMNSVKDLSIRELDYAPNPSINSIGVVLVHISSLEYYYQLYTFSNKGFHPKKHKLWTIALEMDKTARQEFKEESIEFYLEIYNNVRSNTLNLFSEVDDEWLENFSINSHKNNYFEWLHVMEHQSQHLGQIYLLKRLYNYQCKTDSI
ncbi:DinB family protein [Aquimarina sp. ERC-38]|nr:DinB family protein [Aquimarina sp. ERC-38]